MYSRIPKLPNEVVDAILEILKVEEEFKTLTSVARVNHTMYDIAIPKIYETVMFSETVGKGKKGKNNHAMIACGHSHSASRPGRSKRDIRKLIVDNQAVGPPTRKDIATSHTRKLVFQDIPELAISRAYRGVEEVEILSHCMGPSELPAHNGPIGYTEWMEGRFQRCLNAITSSNSSEKFLHVKVHESYEIDHEWEILGRLLTQSTSAISCTFELCSILVDYDLDDALYMAYESQAVVHLDRELACVPETVAGFMALSINGCFEDENTMEPLGQLFLCGLPRLVLDPSELAAASDINEAALVKLCKYVTVWPNLAGSPYKTKLEFFRSRIKLVEPGFRPSLADLYPRPLPR